ncbi:G4 quadruplex nucleic acid binding protein [Thecaphora frezii]
MSAQRAKQAVTGAYAQFANDKAAVEALNAKADLSLVDLTKQLAQLTVKPSQVLGADNQSEQKTAQWLAKLDSTAEDQFTSAANLKALDQELAAQTFLAANEPTAADFALFAALYPTVSKLSAADQHAHPSIVRYVAHISNLPTSSQLGFTPFEPTYEGMPQIERKKPEDLKKEKQKNKEAAKQQQEGVDKKPAAENKDGKKKEKKEKAPKEGKAGSNAGGKKGSAVEIGPPQPSMVDLRVGKIVNITRHPDADSLYLEQVDFGEPEGPRQILSGLVKYVPIEKMENRMVIGVCNLKPASMRGIKSYGMLLCASTKGTANEAVEPVSPPEGSKPGDRVYVEGFEGIEPEAVLNPKKKIFETIQPGYTTTADRQAAWVGPLPGAADPEADKKVRLLRTDKGVCYAETLAHAALS